MTQRPIFHLDSYSTQIPHGALNRNHAVELGVQQTLEMNVNFTRVLAQGSFGSVYEVETKVGNTTRKMVIKVKFAIPSEFLHTYYDRIHNEERAMEKAGQEHMFSNRLCIPKKCVTFKDDEGKNEPFTVYLMEKIDGETLQSEMDRMNKNEQFDLESLRMIVQYMLQGLECLHENGVIYIDLAPDNFVLKVENGFPSLVFVDFSYALTIQRAEKEGVKKFVSANYCAPEMGRIYKDSDNRSYTTNKLTPAVDLHAVAQTVAYIQTRKHCKVGNFLCDQIGRGIDSELLYFLDFMTIISSPKPENRSTARALLQHPWITNQGLLRDTLKQRVGAIISLAEREEKIVIHLNKDTDPTNQESLHLFAAKLQGNELPIIDTRGQGEESDDDKQSDKEQESDRYSDGSRDTSTEGAANS